VDYFLDSLDYFYLSFLFCADRDRDELVGQGACRGLDKDEVRLCRVPLCGRLGFDGDVKAVGVAECGGHKDLCGRVDGGIDAVLERVQVRRGVKGLRHRRAGDGLGVGAGEGLL